VAALIKKHGSSRFSDCARCSLAEYYLCIEGSRGRSQRERDRDAFEQLQGVSNRIPALEVRAACYQAQLLTSKPPRASRDQFSRVKRLVTSGKGRDDLVLRWPYSIAEAVRAVRLFEIFYMEDDRLDKMVKDEFPESETVAECFARISRQTGVPLEADDDLGRRRISMTRAQREDSLRNFMLDCCRWYGEAWERKGEAYRYVVPPDGLRKLPGAK
jgi:hypothetical protein